MPLLTAAEVAFTPPVLNVHRVAPVNSSRATKFFPVPKKSIPFATAGAVLTNTVPLGTTDHTAFPVVSFSETTVPSSSPKKTCPLSMGGEDTSAAEGTVAASHKSGAVAVYKATKCAAGMHNIQPYQYPKKTSRS